MFTKMREDGVLINNVIMFIALLSLFLSLKFVFFLFFILILSLVNTSQIVMMIKSMLPFLCVILLLIFYSLSGDSIGNQLPFPFLESRDIIISVLIVSSLCSMKESVVSRKSIIRSLISISVFISFGKLLILIYCFKNGINPSTIVHAISDATGWQLMTYDVDESLLSRIQFPIDLVTCFLVYFQVKFLIEVRSKINLAILFLLLFSVLITMSRAFWFISVVMLFTALLTSKNKKEKKKYIFIIIAFSVLIYGLFYQSVNSIVMSRVNNSQNTASDFTRALQNRNLSNSFLEKPILGHGIGYFIPSYIRGEGLNRYSYESQLLSLFMKLGIIGFISIITSLLYIVYYNRRLCLTNTKNKESIRVVFISLWLFSGAVNPLLFAVPGGIILFLLTCIDEV